MSRTPLSPRATLIGAGILTVISAFGLVACDQSEPANEPASTPTEQPQKNSMSAEEAEIMAAIEESERTPDMKCLDPDGNVLFFGDDGDVLEEECNERGGDWLSADGTDAQPDQDTVCVVVNKGGLVLPFWDISEEECDLKEGDFYVTEGASPQPVGE